MVRPYLRKQSKTEEDNGEEKKNTNKESGEEISGTSKKDQAIRKQRETREACIIEKQWEVAPVQRWEEGQI